MLRIIHIAVVMMSVLLAGCGDGSQVPATPRSSEVTTAPPIEVLPEAQPEEVTQEPSVPVPPPEVAQRLPEESVDNTEPMGVGIAIRIGNNPVGIDLSTRRLVISPDQRN